MGLSNVQTRESVLKAVQECETLGRKAFLERYGYGRAFNYFLVVDGRMYDSKAIVGVAHGYEFPDLGPLTSDQFSGGSATVQRKLQQLGFEVRTLTDSGATTPNYWWEDSLSERSWIEIRREMRGLGVELRCPFVDAHMQPNPWYDLVDDVRTGDIVYHWNAREERFVGRSVAASARVTDPETGERIIPLQDFVPLETVVGLEEIRSLHSRLDKARDALESSHPAAKLYLPFQFRRDGLRLMSNYFTKLPISMQDLLFGSDGVAEQGLEEPPPEEGPPGLASSSGVRAGFLKPFKPKADTQYLARIQARTHKRGRTHETLVNDFASWLVKQGISVGRNAAIDLGVEDPPVIIEAKAVLSWARSIREAVGQLYEYRFFQVVPPDSKLVFLASGPVPIEWRDYLERDREIGVAWRDVEGFSLTSKARESLGLERGGER